MNGSSPRVWGKSGWIHGNSFTLRFIPTRVGKMSCFCACKAASSVHPHACGENAVFGCPVIQRTRFIPTRVGKMFTEGSDIAWLTGSSPRVWGKSIRCQEWSEFVSVHPHACGENILSQSEFLTSSGSSPRVWGKWAGWR